MPDAYIVYVMKKLVLLSLFVGTKNKRTLQQNVEVVPREKCGEEIPKMWIVHSFVKMFIRFIFFVSIFHFICESDCYKDL